MTMLWLRPHLPIIPNSYTRSWPFHCNGYVSIRQYVLTHTDVDLIRDQFLIGYEQTGLNVNPYDKRR